MRLVLEAQNTEVVVVCRLLPLKKVSKSIFFTTKFNIEIETNSRYCRVEKHRSVLYEVSFAPRPTIASFVSL